ncbi:response regulator [Desulfovibrio sp. OttesenSCG-928-C06]|nr:response regulator [Desulfovibrio sp. OttesenSCG-928-C06]
MNVPFFITGYLAKNVTEDTLLNEKRDKLFALARVLDVRLGDGGYDAIIQEHDAAGWSREEKIHLLNTALQAVTDEVGSASPGLGVGYYSRELDAIITYGPSSQFQHMVGVSIPQEHPGRIVMSANIPKVKFGSMVRGDILNAMIPIERGGKVIGYIWSNELTTDITSQLGEISRNIVLVMLFCFGVTAAVILLLTRRTVRDVDHIIRGVRNMRGDLNYRIPELSSELGLVAHNINDMAEDIGRAAAESDRAISILQIVMGNVEAAVYVCDPATMELVYTNSHLNEMLGRNDLQGKICYEVLQGLKEPCEFCPQKQLFDVDGVPLMEPLHWEFHNERLGRDFMLSDRLVTWPDGRLLHMEVATDITQRNALALAEAANMAQRDFLARMSHEIRTPMNGVLGMTRLAIQADPPPAQLEYLKKIQSSASLLLGIINDILDFSRIESGKMEIENTPFNLHELVDNIRELILPRTNDNNLELRINVDASVPLFAVGDALRISQVLLNLMGNASKFTLSGYVGLDMRAEVLPGGKLRLDCAVTDSGIGISAEQQQALFKPFSQADASTSRQFGGTGLGLSICRALVELMGGSIRMESIAGEGSTFSFFVILDCFDGELTGAVDSVSNELAGVDYAGRKFLLVEDNQINQEIALAILEELKADVDVAENGEEGLKAYLRKDYDLIFMDVRMPVMDGLEATERIRASDKHDAKSIPIIAMTANAMREDREATLEAGMNGHIAKPIDLEELKAVLHKELHERSSM